MKSIPSGCCFAFFLLLLSALPLSFLASAQDSAEGKPKVSMTMCIVPEIEACAPSGYASYASEQPSDCKSLSVGDFDSFIKICGYIHKTSSVPPSTVSLGRTILLAISEYPSPLDVRPNQRKSLTILFEWHTPQSGPVLLKRTNVRRDVSGIPDMEWSGRLAQEKHWIHHERLDAFHPGNVIKWTLSAGGYEWEFWMGE